MSCFQRGRRIPFSIQVLLIISGCGSDSNLILLAYSASSCPSFGRSQALYSMQHGNVRASLNLESPTWYCCCAYPGSPPSSLLKLTQINSDTNEFNFEGASDGLGTLPANLFCGVARQEFDCLSRIRKPDDHRKNECSELLNSPVSTSRLPHLSSFPSPHRYTSEINSIRDCYSLRC